MLIVDDDRDTREMYCESLRSMGFDPATAPSAEEALRMVAEMPPAVVVTDLRFKGRMDGVELARRLRAKAGQRLRIIMLTGARSAPIGSRRSSVWIASCEAVLRTPCPQKSAPLAAAGFSPGGYNGMLRPTR